MVSTCLLSAVIVFAALTEIVNGQKCPYGWNGYTTAPNSKCYRFVTSTKLTWQDARDYCTVHGGDLLKVDTQSEMNWIAAQIKSLTTRNHLRNPIWWTGLNNREYQSTWEWADGTAAKSIIKWRPGEPNNYRNRGENCGELVNNLFNDDVCSNKYYFICNRGRDIPLACDTDRGWQTINGKCYKLYARPNNWIQASRQCSHDGGSLVKIDSSSVELAVHEFAATAKKPLWIGLHSLKVSATAANWIWTNGTQLGTAFWHGQPHLARNQLNTSCAYVSNTLPPSQDWNAGTCNTARGYVCQKPEGVCFPGWVGHAGQCYQFDPQFRLNFAAATTFCSQQGAELLRIDSITGEMFIQSYLREMKDSGASTFWIGLSDDNHDGGPFKWRNGHTVGAHKNWATRTPTNTRGKRDCVYISSSDSNSKWRTTTSCQAARGFVCRIPMNKAVKPMPHTPRPHYGCPPNWRLYQTTCFKLGNAPTDAVTARARCQGMHAGADLAVINSAGVQGYVNRLLRNGINYWIGLNDRAQNGKFVWNDGTPALSYTNWKRGEPSEHAGGEENCVYITNNQWKDSSCQVRAQYLCSLSATNIVLPNTPSPTPAVDWTVKCGQGWSSNPVTSYCYLFSDQQLSWTDAMLQCRVAHGQLVSILSVEEQSYIAGQLASMTSLAVWTGGNDRQTEGGWRWASRDPFSYFNWAPNQPGGNRGQGSDCIAMLKNTAKWDDIPCNSRNGYVCKKLGKVPATTTPKTTTVRVPAGKKLGCRYGWRPWNNNCYAFIKHRGSWDDGNKFCKSIGADLATINSRSEQNFLQSVMPRSTASYANLWIGMNDKVLESQFRWANGQPVTYTNWNTGEPNNWMNKNEDCVDMSLKTGKWNDEMCSMPQEGFLCKRPFTVVSKVQSPPPYLIGCPPGSLGFGSYCFRIIQGDSRSWDSANSKCNTTFHGELATVNDKFLQSFLSSGLVRRSGNFWIGMTDKKSPGTYTWASGHSIKFTSWGKNHTGNEQSTCVAMQGQQPVGLWLNLPCTQRNNYICQLSRKGYTPPPTPPTPFPNVPCPNGWTENYAYCIKFFNGTTMQKNWMDASSYCQGLGGDLASFHTKGNDTAALGLIKGLTMGVAQGAWIGFNDRDTEGGHKWSDGSPVDYTNWNGGEPNNYGNAEDCATLIPSRGWNDLNCYFQLPFICGVPRGTIPATTIAPPAAVTSAQCGSNPNGTYWFFYNNNCYFISPKTGSNSRLSYYDAQTYCADQKSALVSIHTEQENGLLMAKFHSYGPNSFWIGLNKLNNMAYKWTDGTPVDYVSWSNKQPDDYSGSERCALTQKWTGLWNDDLCSQKRGFICKKPLNGVAHKVPPTPNTPGGCPVGFVRAAGGRNKCFYFSGKVRKTWTQAYKYCRSLGSKYDIASVEDGYENEFLITQARTVHGNLWIGLNDHRGSNNFYWQDSSPVVYTNWDNNEPTSAKRIPGRKDTQNCVVVRMYKGHEGKWADVPCNISFPFICSVKQDPNVPKRPPPRTGSCRQGYSFFNSGCYQVKHALKSWTDANSDCKADGGNLASIDTIYESAFIGTLAAGASPYWIGLSDNKSPGLYYWSDSSRVVYASWGPREPSYGQKTGNGCVLSDSGGLWNDTYCNAKHYYACKISQVKPSPTNPASAGSCQNPKWTANGDYCYMANVNNGRSWPEANYLCQQSGMQLASIHSKAEMDFVFNLIKQAKVTNKQFTPNIWIGLSKSAQGAFAWTDSTPTNYFYWAPNEPTSIGAHGETQECVDLDRTQEVWATSSCYTTRGFVCKTPKVISSTLPASTVALSIGPDGNPLVGPQQPQQQNSNSPSSSGSGVSGGAITGAVIGSILVVLLIAFVLIFLVRSGKISLSLPSLPSRSAGEDKAESNGFENNMFSEGNEADT